MDLDIIVKRDFGELKENYAGVGYSTALYCGILNLAKDEVGKEVASKLLKYRKFY